MYELIWYAGIILAAIILLTGLKIVRPYEKASIETLGKFKGIRSQGITYVIPFVQKLYKVGIAEALIDVEPQEVITKDNLNARVDAQVYYKVKEDNESVYKALYKAEDYVRQIVNLARTTLRDVIGNMNFEQANSERDKINKQLQETLEKESNAWGIQIVRTEIAEITPPKEVQATMNKIIQASNEKVAARDTALAAKIEASGIKEAAIQKAEGDKQSAVLRAEGDSQAIIKVANANAERIKVVNESARKHFKDEAQVLKRLETAESALKKGSKYIVPQGSDLVTVVSEAAGITPLPSKKK